jgi:hypothetical protein
MRAGSANLSLIDRCHSRHHSIQEEQVKGSISRRQERVTLELDLQEWSWMKSVILFARKAANGPLFANDVESPQIEKMARGILDELGFEQVD